MGWFLCLSENKNNWQKWYLLNQQMYIPNSVLCYFMIITFYYIKRLTKLVRNFTLHILLHYDLIWYVFIKLLQKDETAFRELDLDNLISKLVLPKVRINNTGSLNASTYSTGEKGIPIIVCEGFFLINTNLYLQNAW